MRRIWGGLAVALLALTLWITPAPPAHAEETKLDQLRSGAVPLRVGTDATFPPFESTTANGDKVGFDIDMINELAKRAGIKRVEFIQMPFGNIVPALQANQIDVGASAIYISEARAKVIDFSDIYYPGGLAIFVPEKTDSITSVADLAGKKVALQVGTKSVEWLAQNQPQAIPVTVQTNEQMFTSVKLGQSDALITGAPAGNYFIAQQGGIKQVGERLTAEDYGFAFQKGDAAIRVAFNEALAQMRADGSYQTLADQYFSPKATEQAGEQRRTGIIHPSTIIQSAGEIGRALLVTLQVIVLSLLLSLVLGTLGGLAKLSHVRPINWLGRAYVSVIRGTPFVVQMFFIYFGLPQLGLQLPPMVAGVIALGLYSGSYVTEIFRGAVQSVDTGQLEAARSCGMSPRTAMRYIVLPQALVRMLPPLGNEFVSLTKNSALVSFITIHELFLVGQAIISRTFDALTVYLFIGIVYYLLTNAIGYATGRVEKRLARFI